VVDKTTRLVVDVEAQEAHPPAPSARFPLFIATCTSFPVNYMTEMFFLTFLTLSQMKSSQVKSSAQVK
jgi:hypothetical protein